MKRVAGMAAVALVLMFAGAWALQGQDAPRPRGPLPGAEAAKVSPDDVAAALKAVSDAKKLIGEDKKAQAVQKLDEAAKLLAKIQAAATQPAGTAGSAGTGATGAPGTPAGATGTPTGAAGTPGGAAAIAAGATGTPPGAAAADTFKGTVHATMTRKIPRLNVNGAEYDLSAAATADASVKDTLAKISKGEATGRYVVKGTATGNGISVLSIRPE